MPGAAAAVLTVGCGGDEFTDATLVAAGGDSAGGSGGSAGKGTSGGSGGSSSGSCTEAFECDAADLYSCADAQTTLIESCATAALCDAAAGECVPPACTVGVHTCSGEVLQVCNADRTGFEMVATCASAALCNVPDGSCDTPVCDLGQYRCTGSVLEACSADRTGFVEVLDCGTADLCDSGSGECQVACTPDAYQCTNATLLQCNAAGTSLGVAELCFSAALCNQTLGQCDEPACAPNEHNCEGPNLGICNDDRTGFEHVETCATAGLCVEATGSCTEPACDVDEYECQGNLLRGCNDARTNFEVDQTCNAQSQDCSLSPPGCRELTEYAGVLDGFTIEMPCQGDYPQSPARVCYSSTGVCSVSVDPIFNGAQPFDQTLIFGGNSGTIYDVTVRVQGQVEAKVYSGGTDQSSSANLPADGFYVGGTPSVSAALPYNIYLMRVSSPLKDYFFNSIATSDGDTRVRESTFDVDYEATIQIEGGATMRMVVSDPNCLSTKNCADPVMAGSCTPHSLANLDASISEDIGGQPFAGQFVGFLVQSVTK